MNGPFNGRHMTAILVGFFGVVILVNLTMARFAVGTFGGTVVDNSYVASQEFNAWLEQAETSRALGWQAQVKRGEGGRLEVALSGAPAGTSLQGEARHPLGREPDTALTFTDRGQGRFVSREVLAEGRWIVRLAATGGTQTWRHEKRLP